MMILSGEQEWPRINAAFRLQPRRPAQVTHKIYEEMFHDFMLSQVPQALTQRPIPNVSESMASPRRRRRGRQRVTTMSVLREAEDALEESAKYIAQGATRS